MKTFGNIVITPAYTHYHELLIIETGTSAVANQPLGKSLGSTVQPRQCSSAVCERSCGFRKERIQPGFPSLNRSYESQSTERLLSQPHPSGAGSRSYPERI